MTTTFTTNKQFPIQSFGANINTWGDVVNAEFIQVLDKNLGGTLNRDVSGGEDIALTADEAQNLIHILSGTITANIEYIVPNQGAFYLVTNNAAGAFTITMVPFEGSGFVLPVGETILVQIDASDALASTATQVPSAATGVNSGKVTKITVADTPYTVKATDFAIRADCSGGTISVLLTGPNNAWFRVKKTDSSVNVLTVVGTIDGGTNYPIQYQSESADFQKDSDGWWVF